MSLGECHKTSLVISQHWSKNGLVPSGERPLLEPMLTELYDTIWRHLATMIYVAVEVLKNGLQMIDCKWITRKIICFNHISFVSAQQLHIITTAYKPLRYWYWLIVLLFTNCVLIAMLYHKHITVRDISTLCYHHTVVMRYTYRDRYDTILIHRYQ